VGLPNIDCPLNLFLAPSARGLAVTLAAYDWVLQDHRLLTTAASPGCGWSNSCSTSSEMPDKRGVRAVSK
jgi:hypothetical protein